MYCNVLQFMSKLIWDDWNCEHIKKHKVTVDEVKEVFTNKTVVIDSYLGRKMILGVSAKGRLLAVILSYALQKEGYVVSARDMNKREKKLFYEKNNETETN